MGRSQRRTDALMMGFAAHLADRQKPLRPQTRRSYKRRVQVAMDLCAKKDVDFLAADERTIRFVLGTLPPGPSSQNGMISALSAFYAYLMELTGRPDNPVDRIARRPTFRHYPRPLTVEDCLSYERAATALGIRYEMIAVLGLYQGFRVMEMATAQWDWWFPANGAVFIDVTGKGGGTGRVGAHDRTVDALRRLRMAHQDGQWLFPSSRARCGHLSDRSIERLHHAICDEAGLECHPVLHQLRHTFATYLRASGADVAMVQKGLRHRHISSTMIYMDVLPQELETAINRVDYKQAAKQQNLPQDVAGSTLDSHEREHKHKSPTNVPSNTEVEASEDEDWPESG